jgi:16S rRNA (guanine966-N2)-methyltransferase
VTGLSVLDLFAGSGALGIEALSRGAADADFVENDRAALAALLRNLEPLEVVANVHNRDALGFVRTAAEAGYDLVFVDPPYDSAVRLGGPLSADLPRLLNDKARIVTESDKRSPLELDLPLLTERVYGDTRIAVHAHG